MKIASSDVQMFANSTSSTEITEKRSLSATRGTETNRKSEPNSGRHGELDGRSNLDSATQIEISRFSQLLQKLDEQLANVSNSLEAVPVSGAVEELDEASSDPRVQLIKSLIEYMLGRSIDLFAGWRGRKPQCECENVTSKPQETVPPAAINQGNAGWRIEYQARRVIDIQEQTAFQSRGTVQTSDGRSIQFDLSFELQRQTHIETSVDVAMQAAKKVDPLMLNLSDGPVQLSDRKFAFDLDSDGKKEQISFATNAGFLALDKNHNGKIDDGSELFGPNTSNGFAELKNYDADHNGWIDENDPVYEQLRLWTKDNEGTDHVVSLKQAQVGALSITNVATRFTVNGSQQQALGQLAASGIWLSEDGRAHQLQQIDLVV